MTRTDLDSSVDTAAKALAQRGLPEPDALFLLGTGLGLLPGQLEGGKRLPLTRLAGMPEAWRERVLHTGRMGGASVWLLEDAPGTPEHGSESPSVRDRMRVLERELARLRDELVRIRRTLEPSNP